ncbi:MAG: GNAT family N-acetyltransferase [Gemmatimonadaceae bacterium]
MSRYLARSFSVEDIRHSLSGDHISFFAVEDAESFPVAYAYLRDSPAPPDGVTGQHALEIVRFYVDGAVQGRGIGSALMNSCLSEARGRGADVIWLQVWKEAPWAVAFYTRMGFTVVGSAPFYFGDQVGDDYIMGRTV